MHDTVLITLGLYFVYSAAVDAMPEPLPEKQRTFYAWLYRFTHVLAGSLSKIAQARYPQLGAGSPAAVVAERETVAVVK